MRVLSSAVQGIKKDELVGMAVVAVSKDFIDDTIDKFTANLPFIQGGQIFGARVTDVAEVFIGNYLRKRGGFVGEIGETLYRASGVQIIKGFLGNVNFGNLFGGSTPAASGATAQTNSTPSGI